MRYKRTSRFQTSFRCSMPRESAYEEEKEVAKPKSLSDPNKVFKEEPEDLDRDGYVRRYYLKKEDYSGYYIGIENTGRKSYKFVLNLDGMKIAKGSEKGKSRSVFNLAARTRIVFETVINKGAYEVGFEFEEL